MRLYESEFTRLHDVARYIKGERRKSRRRLHGFYQAFASRIVIQLENRIDSSRAEFIDRYSRSFPRQYLSDLISD